jgi:hypothetical protein|tara:strand:+ start:641 stop:1045 length:405 start_codon:yes stop_codon:yes gene_type:complete
MYKLTIRGICAMANSNAKRRSNKKHLPYNLSTNYLQSIFPKDFICPILKYKMVVNKKQVGKLSPTLDRINPRLGYIKGNVEFVCMLANHMMSNANGNDLKQFSKWINNRYRREVNNNDKKYVHKTLGVQQVFKF